MKISFLVFSIFLSSCGGRDNKSRPDPETITPKPLPSPVKPKPHYVPKEPEVPEGEIIWEYKTDKFFPLIVEQYQIKKSDLAYLDDYLKYQQGIALNWETTMDGGYVPTLYLSQWNPDEIEYIDETNGKIKGFERLEVFRKKMLKKCPVLALPENNSPVQINWYESEQRNVFGLYKAIDVILSSKDGDVKYHGGHFPKPKSKIWVSGINPDYVEYIFVHEWGHHLMFSVAINEGKNSHSTWKMLESFAEIFEATCGIGLNNPEINESDYNRILEDKEILISRFERKTSLIDGTHYNMESMEYCISHEKHLGKFNPNEFATALIGSLRCVEGRKQGDKKLWPIVHDNGTRSQAPWAAAGYSFDPLVNAHEPYMYTRAEFLSCFRKRYDCGLANDLIDADIRGMEKGEW